MDLTLNVLQIIWNLIFSTGTWVSYLNVIFFTDFFQIPGLEFTLWNMFMNPITFGSILLLVVAKKLVPLV